MLSPEEQAALTAWILECELPRGRARGMAGRTFLAPVKGIKGKGRETIQFGVCYSYINPPGITDDVVEAMPKTLEDVITRLMRWGVLPASSRPDSCIIKCAWPLFFEHRPLF